MSKKQKILLIIILLLIPASCFAAFKGYQKYSRNKGVEILTSKIMEPPDITYYLQRDDIWAEDHLGTSKFTMGSSGCLVTSIASMLETYGIEVTPGELNSRFNQHNVYNASGDVVWGKISDSYPDIEVLVFSSVNSKKVEEAVENSQYPLVKVRYMGSGYWHWVLLIGSDENGYLCMDPLYNEKKPRSLADHGGKIYSWRLLDKKK